jgi:hypothetical protein
MKHFLGWLFRVGLYVLLPLPAFVLALIVLVHVLAAMPHILLLLFWLGIFIILARLFFPRYLRRFWGKCLPLLSRLLTALESLFRRLRSKIPDVRLDGCPSLSGLKDLLADRLPAEDHAKLATHLEDCAACQHRVEGLTAGQRSWPGRTNSRPISPAAAPSKPAPTATTWTS